LTVIWKKKERIGLKAHNTNSGAMVSIFGFVVGFGRYFNKNCGSRSVSVFMVVYKQNTTRDRLPDVDEK